MRQFTPVETINPAMAERIPGSMFTPAIAAWSSPGALGSYLSGLPSWTGYAVAAGLLGLAYMKKIPWWAAGVGAFAAWYTLGNAGNMVTTLTSGQAISANGTTLNFSVNTPGILSTAPNGVATLTDANNHTYPVLQTQSNSDGTTTYYVDNPTS